jgi:hypothetical protein
MRCTPIGCTLAGYMPRERSPAVVCPRYARLWVAYPVGYAPVGNTPIRDARPQEVHAPEIHSHNRCVLVRDAARVLFPLRCPLVSHLGYETRSEALITPAEEKDTGEEKVEEGEAEKEGAEKEDAEERVVGTLHMLLGRRHRRQQG